MGLIRSADGPGDQVPDRWLWVVTPSFTIQKRVNIPKVGRAQGHDWGGTHSQVGKDALIAGEMHSGFVRIGQVRLLLIVGSYAVVSTSTDLY